MKERRAFLLFAGVGGIAAAINFGARLALQRILNFEVAVIIAYLIGMTIAFALNRILVFEAGGDWRGQFVRFGIINVIALAQVFVVSVGLARLLFPALSFDWHSETLAHLIGLASPIVTSYWGHKHFSFSQRQSALGPLA